MQTTLGSILINESLPEDLKDHSRQVDKKALRKIIEAVGQKHPQDYGRIVKTIKDLGDKHSTLLGSSFSLDDFAPKDISHIYKKYQPEYDRINKLTNETQKEHALREVNIKAEDEINKVVSADLKKDGNRFLLWGKAGAKGSDANFRQMLYASGNQVDVKEELFPHMSKRSFAEGLSPSDFFITSTGARKGVVGSFLSVRDPGAFGKELFAATNDMVTTMNDCGTKKGKTYPVHSGDALDRYLLQDVKSYHRNTAVTHLMQDSLARQGVTEISVRTPLGCLAAEGVCSMCVGLKEDGNPSHVGDAIGIRSAQSLTEPLTQLALGSKHGGGVVQKKKPAFLKLRQLLHAPEHFPDGAVLSNTDGKVQKIEHAADGGVRVFVNGVSHYVTPNTPVTVKLNQTITKGDMLADGMINPKELVDKKGIEAGREYLSQVIRDTYAENGKNGHPKVFETIARAIINHGVVQDPGDHDLLPEQIVRWNQNTHKTEHSTNVLHPLDAIGYRLKNDTNGLKAHTMLTDKNINSVAHLPTVSVYKNPAVIKPFMISSERAALHKDDFISAMGYRNIKQVLESAVSEFDKVPLHSYNPISTYAMGANFSVGTEKGMY